MKKICSAFLILFSIFSSAVPAWASFPAVPFKDIAEEAWYHDAVYFIYTKGIVSGTGGTGGVSQYSPEESVSRAMFVTMLGRLADKMGISIEGTASFKDIAPTDYFYSYVSWASTNDVISGYSTDVFAPQDEITREQAAKILISFTEVSGLILPDTSSSQKFADLDSISPWASEPVQKCIASGLLKGYGDGTFRPQDTLTRAEAAQIICSLYDICGIDTSDNDMNAIPAEFKAEQSS